MAIQLPGLPIKRLCLMLGGVFGGVLTSTQALFAAALTFDLEAFSSGLAATVDVSRFNTNNLISPGIYRVDVVVNGQALGRRDLDFAVLGESPSVQPCLDRALLEQLGVEPDTPALGAVALDVSVGSGCAALKRWLPLASSTFDAGTLEWSVSIPQAYLKSSARGHVDPIYWNDGINVGLLSYTFSTSTATSGRAGDRSYLGLNTGINLGRWRLRHQGAQAWNSAAGWRPYQNTATYLQRSIAPWRAQLTLGDSFSSGQILEGVRVRGISLATDDRMLAPSRQGYAPQVQGVADGNASVTVSQNGYTIYETTVAPGPFVISDLFATGYGGDLTVSVNEVDGRRNTFVVPYSVAPQLLRADVNRYSATLGRVQQRGVEGGSPLMFQGTLAQGLTGGLTLYGGGTLAHGYAQGKLGLAMSTALGAFSLDGSESRTSMPGLGSLAGQSLGLGYNKNLPGLGTHFVLAAYRFSTQGYLGLYDALTVRERERRGMGIAGFARQKTRLDLNIIQAFGQGTLSLYGSSVDYWGRRAGRQTSFTLSYGSTWKQLAWNLSLQRSRIESSRHLTDREHSDRIFFAQGHDGRLDNRLMLTLSMPLGGGLGAPSVSSSLAWDRGDTRGAQQQVAINGLLGENAQGHYGVSSSRTAAGASRTSHVNAYAGYRSSSANVRAGYGQTQDSAQLSFSAEGGIVAHRDGITLSRRLGDASALVHVPNAQGAMLSNANGVRVDASGYAVVPALRAFQRNVIGIDPQGMAMDVELKESSQTTVPTLGAVALLRFETVSGRAVVVKAAQSNGKPLPFAAQVFDQRGREVGVIGQASKAFVRGIADQGRLTVKWSETPSGRCYIDYQLPAQTAGQRQASADLLVGRCLASPDQIEVSAR